MKINCVQCHKVFELTDGEVEFYKKKGYNLPKRCKSCREKNKSEPTADISAAEKRQEKLVWAGVLVLLLLIAAVVFFSSGGDNELAEPPVSIAETTDAQNPTVTDEGQSAPNEETDAQNTAEVSQPTSPAAEYSFRTQQQLDSHWEKHGAEFDYADKYEYLAGANRVINDPNALTKTEKEDGDFVFYLEDSNEFVILSTDGFIRTYFRPDAGLDYFNKQ
ncbi:MAG: zinc-ribbon domain containing protein [Oscillospiraceae bacterium]